MKHIVKWIVPLLLAAVAAGCGTERRSAREAYRSWPKGLSVSLTMPAEKLQQVKEAGFDYVEVTLNSLRGKSPEERLAAIGRFRADAEQPGLTVWSVHLPFGRAWDISSPNDSLRAVHSENSVNAINTLAETVRDTGAQLLIEDLPRTCLCNTSDEMLALFGRTDPSVGICFDTNHLLQETPGRLPVPFSWPRAATTNLRFRHSPTLSSWGSKPPIPSGWAIRSNFRFRRR